MRLHELKMRDYEEYKRSHYFEKLRLRVGVGKRKCRRCKVRAVRLPHHLTYKTLGEERNDDVVGVCHVCNNLAHFYDNGERVPVTTDGYYLKLRWKEINSRWYKFKQKRPSDLFNWIIKTYSV